MVNRNITITEDDRDRALVVDVGDAIELHLQENPTTGYRWFFDDLDSRVEVELDEFHPGGTPLVPGGGGVREWRLRPTAAGDFGLSLKLWREWEDESAAIERFAVRLTVE